MDKYKLKVNAGSMTSALELATITMDEHFHLGFTPENKMFVESFNAYGGSRFIVDIDENKNSGISYFWKTDKKIINVFKSFENKEVELTISEAETIIAYKKTKIKIPNYLGSTENHYLKNAGLGESLNFNHNTLCIIDEYTSGYEADLKFGKVWSCLNISNGSAQATDSNNLIIKELGKVDKDININIPKGALQNMLKVSNQWSEIKVHDNRIYVVNANFGGVVAYNLNVTQYPDVVGMFDKQTGGSPIQIDKYNLIKAINLIGIIRGADNFNIEFTITKGLLNLSYNKSKTSIMINNEHEPIEGTFGINGDRFIKMLDKIPDGNPLINFNTPLKPITYKSEKFGVKALVMPIKLA